VQKIKENSGKTNQGGDMERHHLFDYLKKKGKGKKKFIVVGNGLGG